MLLPVAVALLLTTGGPPFVLASGGHPAALVVSDDDWAGVRRAAHDLQGDIEKITGTRPRLTTEPIGTVVIIGTLGKSPLIDQLVQTGKLDQSLLRGRWETFVRAVIDRPFPNVARALVIAGSDKRGTIYGIYDVSQQIGVSPWYWWADVPVAASRRHLLIDPGRARRRRAGGEVSRHLPQRRGARAHRLGARRSSAASTTASTSKVFELILRLKGNYLWPAMWSNAFNDDDPRQRPPRRRIRHRHGHLAPRADDARAAGVDALRQGPVELREERRRCCRTSGAQGIAAHARLREASSRIGMRGDGDEPMARGKRTSALLETIVADQREIIARRDAASRCPRCRRCGRSTRRCRTTTSKGMRVPDDVHAAVVRRQLGQHPPPADAEERKRPGGAGIYYHFDYVGGPRIYKWINTTPICPRSGSRCTWPGATAPTASGSSTSATSSRWKFPIEFFLILRLEPGRVAGRARCRTTSACGRRASSARSTPARSPTWSTRYAQYNGRRKPELLAPDTYSLLNYREAERVVADYNALAERAQRVARQLPAERRDAFFELVAIRCAHAAVLDDLYGDGRGATTRTRRRDARRPTTWQSVRAACSRSTRNWRASTTRTSPAASGTT